MTRNKVEDGMGFSGLVPSAAELRIDRELREEQREEIQRLNAHINKQDAEIERLKAAGDAAFYAMCAYRDDCDCELFQDAIDALGAALAAKGE